MQLDSQQFDDAIESVNAGAAGARDRLFALAYPELRKLARARLRDGGRNTYLDTTALVHESYLRLSRASRLHLEHRRAFFGYASQVMRSVIVDAVRERQAQRRAGERDRLTLDTQAAAQIPAQEDDVLRVHEALEALAQAEPRMAKAMEMRYYGGYREQEIAEALAVAERTVRRDLDKASTLLRALLAD